VHPISLALQINVFTRGGLPADLADGRNHRDPNGLEHFAAGALALTPNDEFLPFFLNGNPLKLDPRLSMVASC